MVSGYSTAAVVVVGLAAGLVVAVFETLTAALMTGSVEGAVMPLRMIAAMVEGPDGLQPRYPATAAVVLGLILLLSLSIVFTAILAILATWLPPGTTPATVALVGAVYGTCLWLVSFYLVAPPMQWSWFPDRTEPVVAFVAHALCFGAFAGWLLTRVEPEALATT